MAKKQKLMIIKELFEGPVGDYCIARNTIKCLLSIGLNTKCTSVIFRRRKKSCLFPLTRPTLFFHADPKVFFSSISEKNPN